LTGNTPLKLISMSEINAEEVQWLWYPYIPLGKLTILQGDHGEGKTSFILAVIAALTRGDPLPECERAAEPMNVIYQTAEDGLADTIKPRLESAGADCTRVLVIDEGKRELTLCDARLEEAIRRTAAKLIVLDPLQAYLGSNVDMHRANEVRPVLKRLSVMAERTQCAVILIGHMNKAQGLKSGYRGLGSIDFRASARSVLIVGRLKSGDMVITKSISRFARNTVTLLETVRDLKALGIDVFFEEQSIHTLSADGELMLSILASYAQEESLSASENQKWRVRKNFEEGKPWNGTLLGYRYRNGVYVIEPDEAETVRRIFREYLSGKGIVSIANDLNADGVRTRYENACSKGGVSRILHNYAYSGNLLLQKTFRENHLTKKTVVNEGQLPMYHAEGTHEAIISLEDYQAVQAEIAKRAKKYAPVGKFFTGRYPFSSLITCAHCGKHYRRKITATGPVWICSTYNYQGRAACPSKQIPEPTLTAMTADLDIGDLTEIIAEDGNTLVFRFKDGRKAVKRWHDRSRAKSWTPEMKEAARQKAIERNKRNG